MPLKNILATVDQAKKFSPNVDKYQNVQFRKCVRAQKLREAWRKWWAMGPNLAPGVGDALLELGQLGVGRERKEPAFEKLEQETMPFKNLFGVSALRKGTEKNLTEGYYVFKEAIKVGLEGGAG